MQFNRILKNHLYLSPAIDYLLISMKILPVLKMMVNG